MTPKKRPVLGWLADKIGYVLGMLLGISIMATLILFMMWLAFGLFNAIEGS